MADHNLFTHKAFGQTTQSHRSVGNERRDSQFMCWTKGGGKPIGLAVMDYNKILVLDDGCVAELGNPCQLLQNPDGLFYTFVKENGKEFLQNCIEVAEIRTRK
jgi:hypothetical protein